MSGPGRAVVAAGALAIAGGVAWWVWPSAAPEAAAPADASAAPAPGPPQPEPPRDAAAPGIRPPGTGAAERRGDAERRGEERAAALARDPLAPGPDAPPEQRQLWSEIVAPLFYPPEHPRTGEYRDEVQLPDVLAAKRRYVEELHADEPHMHVGVIELEKRLTLGEARDLTPGLDWGDRAERLRIYEILRDAPENPEAPPFTYEFIAPGHPEARSLLDKERARVLEEATRHFTEARGGS